MPIKRKKIIVKELFNKLNIKNEEEIRINNIKSLKILSKNGYENILGFYKTNKRNIMSIILENDLEIKGVIEHKVLTKKGWNKLKNLNKKDYVYTKEGFKKIIKIKYLKEKENCYDLQVENTNSYYGNKILNHNTEIFLSICNLMNKKTLILFARIDLAHQTLKRAERANLDCGIVQGNNVDENHLIVMCTVQSAHKLKDKYEMVIVDECHRSLSPQYQKILKRNDFIYRFGFSATPFVKDKYKTALVKQWLGIIEYTLPANTLIEEKRIAEPIINIIEINNPKNLQDTKWEEAELEGVIYNKTRNEIISNLASKLPFSLILVKRISHGYELQKLIPNSIFLHGGIEVEIRQQAIEDFENYNDIVLIASTIFDEGISINSIRNLFIVGAGKSLIKTIQRLGRGLRIDEGKKSVNIYDFKDSFNRILLRQSIERIKTYKNEGFSNIIYL